jgi:hypothetical protein
MESQEWTEVSSHIGFGASVYASALMKAWSEEFQGAHDEQGQPAVAAPSTSQQEKSYAAFEENVYVTLYTMDRSAREHDIRFAAHDDGWTLVDFEPRWEALPTATDNLEPRSFGNRDPSTAKDDAGTFSRHTASLILRYGSVSSAQRHMLFIANSCFNSFPGLDSMGPSTSLHGRLRQLTTRQWRAGDACLLDVLNKVEYRMNLMSVATHMPQAAKISLPDQLTCHEFDRLTFEIETRKDLESLRARKYHAAKENIFAAVVLPSPGRGQGYCWIKSHKYLAAALALDERIKTPDDMSAALHKLKRSKILTSINLNRLSLTDTYGSFKISLY